MSEVPIGNSTQVHYFMFNAYEILYLLQNATLYKYFGRGEITEILLVINLIC